eukprot:1573588-Rhodomonas_salina.1
MRKTGCPLDIFGGCQPSLRLNHKYRRNCPLCLISRQIQRLPRTLGITRAAALHLIARVVRTYTFPVLFVQAKQLFCV